MKENKKKKVKESKVEILNKEQIEVKSSVRCVCGITDGSNYMTTG
jgi:hypothetical protein